MIAEVKYDVRAVAGAILLEAIAESPINLMVDALIERIVADPKDKKEVETAEKALGTLLASGLICVAEGELVKPTEAALHANSLLG